MGSRIKTKDAVAFILDVGKSMKKLSTNGNCNVLSEAKYAILRILEQKIFSDSPNEYILIVIGCNETKNDLKQEGSDQYENIFVFQHLQRPTFELLRYIEDIEASDIDADLSDGIIVAADILSRQTEGQKFSSVKIALVTNFGGKLNIDDFQQVIEAVVVQVGYDLVLISPFTFESQKAHLAAKKLKQEHTKEEKNGRMCFEVIKKIPNHYVYSFDEANDALKYLEPKRISPQPWFADLILGSKLKIPIVGYIKTTQSKTKTWSLAKKESNGEEIDTTRSDGIKRENEENGDAKDNESENRSISRKTIFYADEEGKEVVDQSEIIKGYAYGSTRIPVTEEDEAAMKYVSERKGIEILFFTSKANIKPHYNSGDKTMIIAYSHKDKNAKHKATFDAFARALHETSCVAIVRYCRLERFSSQLGYLAPVIDSEKVVFTYIRLPFAEDMRYYRFSDFDVKKKDIPTEKQLALIDNLIDCMDLSKAGPDGTELFVCEETHDPNFQLQFNAILNKLLKKYSPEKVDILEVPPQFVPQREQVLNKIKQEFVLEIVTTKRDVPLDTIEVEKVEVSEVKEIKVEEEGGAEEEEELDVSINTANPKKSFEELIASKPKAFKMICKKLEEVITKFVATDRMGFNDKKVCDCLQSYRMEAIKQASVDDYNLFLQNLKDKIKQRQLWKKIVNQKLSLISKVDSESSRVSLQEVEEFNLN